jgi:hypothetical protein
MDIQDVIERVRGDYARSLDWFNTQHDDGEHDDNRLICTEVIEVLDFLMEQNQRLEEESNA